MNAEVVFWEEKNREDEERIDRLCNKYRTHFESFKKECNWGAQNRTTKQRLKQIFAHSLILAKDRLTDLADQQQRRRSGSLTPPQGSMSPNSLRSRSGSGSGSGLSGLRSRTQSAPQQKYSTHQPASPGKQQGSSAASHTTPTRQQRQPQPGLQGSACRKHKLKDFGAYHEKFSPHSQSPVKSLSQPSGT